MSSVPWRLTDSLAYLLTYLKAGLKVPDNCCCNSIVHCSTGPQQNVDDDYCVCVGWRQSRGVVFI